jgi:hypothetical protein
MEAGFASPTIADGVFYVMDNKGKVHALDAMTGKPVWKRPYSAGTIGKASLVYGDGKLYVAEANGRVVDPEGREGAGESRKCSAARGVSGNAQESGREYMIFGSVAIANGRVYLSRPSRVSASARRMRKPMTGRCRRWRRSRAKGCKARAGARNAGGRRAASGSEEAVRGEAVRRDGATRFRPTRCYRRGRLIS